jgi:hypothetical protein
MCRRVDHMRYECRRWVIFIVKLIIRRFFSHVLTEHEFFFSGPCCPPRTLHLMIFQCSAHFGCFMLILSLIVMAL